MLRSTSYPFLALARYHNVPYGLVLAYSDCLSRTFKRTVNSTPIITSTTETEAEALYGGALDLRVRKEISQVTRELAGVSL